MSKKKPTTNRKVVKTITPIAIKVDYLSARLTKTFDLACMQKTAFSPIVDEATGEIIGTQFEKEQIRLRTLKGGVQVVSAFRGAELTLWQLALDYELPITRLDLAVDFKVANDFEARQLYEKFEGAILTFLDEQDYQVSRQKFENSGSGENGQYGSLYFNRTGPVQLRIYAKDLRSKELDKELGGKVVRVEWQLRNGPKISPASELFEFINSNGGPQSPDALFSAFQIITSEKFGGNEDFFQIANGIGTGGYRLERKTANKKESGFEDWVLTTIKTALARHTIETGRDLAFELWQLVQAQVIEHGNIDRQKGNGKLVSVFKAAEYNLEAQRRKQEVLDRLAENSRLDREFSQAIVLDEEEEEENLEERQARANAMADSDLASYEWTSQEEYEFYNGSNQEDE